MDATSFGGRRRREGKRLAGGALLALLAAVAIALAALAVAGELRYGGRLGLPLDDAWIHLALARRMALGDGMATADGRLVPASTAPLWTALLTLAFALPGSPLAWAKALGVALWVGTAAAAAGLARELGAGRAAPWAAALVVATPWLGWSALSGMEVLLFAFLTLEGMRRHLLELQRETAALPASLALLALAALARPEGVLCLALAAGERSSRRGAGARLLAGLLTSALVLAPALLFNRLAGGSFLPSTHAVKAPPLVDLVPSATYLRVAAGVLAEAQPVAFVFALAGAAAIAARARRGVLLPALWPPGLLLAEAVLAGEGPSVPVGNFGRYLFPLLPALAALAAVGAGAALERLPGRGRGAATAVLVLLLAPGVAGLWRGVGRYLQTVSNVEASDVAAARWLAGWTPADALVAAQDVGALGYHLPGPLLDLAGILDPEVVPVVRGTGAAGEGYWEDRLLAFLEKRRPELLVVFPTSYPRLVAQPGFVPLRRFPVPSNVTMAGDELVVYRTPWARPGLARPGLARPGLARPGLPTRGQPP